MDVSKLMPLFDEKRQKTDRRKQNDGPPSGSRERRNKKERRQIAISEISFQEWARYFLKFKKCSVAKVIAQQTAMTAKTMAVAVPGRSGRTNRSTVSK
jgi:hypothetical protein